MGRGAHRAGHRLLGGVRGLTLVYFSPQPKPLLALKANQHTSTGRANVVLKSGLVPEPLLALKTNQHTSTGRANIVLKSGRV